MQTSERLSQTIPRQPESGNIPIFFVCCLLCVVES